MAFFLADRPLATLTLRPARARRRRGRVRPPRGRRHRPAGPGSRSVCETIPTSRPSASTTGRWCRPASDIRGTERRDRRVGADRLTALMMSAAQPWGARPRSTVRRRRRPRPRRGPARSQAALSRRSVWVTMPSTRAPSSVTGSALIRWRRSSRMRLGERRVGRHRDHVARHDRRAGDRPGAAAVDAHLHPPQDLLQVAAVDVEELVEILQRRVEVGGPEPDPGVGGRVGGPRAGRAQVRIGAPGQVVEQQGGREQDQRIGGDRPEDEAVAQCPDRRAAEDRRQRHGPARRVQAAQGHHQGDRHADGAGGGHERIGHPRRRRDTHQRGDQIAAEDRPGLRQGARRDGEEQDRGGAHRGDQDRQRLGADRGPADQARRQDAHQGPGRRAQALALADRGQLREETPQDCAHRIRGSHMRRTAPRGRRPVSVERRTFGLYQTARASCMARICSCV